MHRLSSRWTSTALLLASSALYASCDSSDRAAQGTAAASASSPREAAPSSSVAGSAAGGTQPPVVASASAASPETPRAKEYQHPSEDALGKLPAGIGLQVGANLPAVELRAADGKPIALKTLSERGALLVVFYRGGWCPYCNFQIRELTRAMPELSKRGVTPVAISVDQVSEAAKTRAGYDVPFPILSDPDLEAHDGFRVTRFVGTEELTKLGGYGIDLEKASGRTHHKIAVPAIFLVDDEGTVRWAHADEDYKTRPSVPQLLGAIDRALSRP